MRKFDSPYIADWFAISLRWLTLFALTLTLPKSSELLSLWPLFVLVFWNLSMSVIAGLNIRINYHRQLAVLVDLVLAGLLFWKLTGMPFLGLLHTIIFDVQFKDDTVMHKPINDGGSRQTAYLENILKKTPDNMIYSRF